MRGENGEVNNECLSRTELLNGRLKLLVLVDIGHGHMLLLSSLGAYKTTNNRLKIC